MEYLQTISKMALAGLAVWRITRAVHAAFDDRRMTGDSQPEGSVRVRPDIPGGRVMDFLYWIGIWMSAQTALWVACGFAGVLLHWLAFSGISRMARWLKNSNGTANATAVPAILPTAKDCNRSVQLCL